MATNVDHVPSSPESRATTPVAGARQRFPDQLRGLALLGIVVVNAPYMALSADGYTPESIAEPVDQAAAFLVTMLATGKFYLIFSFLFGYSATFIVRQDSGPDAVGMRRYRRRLVGLAAVGLAHAIFFFIGDILVSYALLGGVLMLLFGWNSRAVRDFGIAIYLLASSWLVLLFVAAFSEGESTSTQSVPAIVRLNQELATGSFLEVAAARVDALPATLLSIGSAQWGFALSAFALGLVAGRGNYLGDLDAHHHLWLRLVRWGLPLGLSMQAFAAWLAFADGTGYGTSPLSFAGLAVGFITAPVLAAGYVGGLALLFLRHRSALAPAENAGKASLSVYIGESVILSAIFCGWGLGWFGELGATAVTVIAIGSWIVLAGAAAVWLRFFRRGPLETLMARWVKLGGARPPG